MLPRLSTCVHKVVPNLCTQIESHSETGDHSRIGTNLHVTAPAFRHGPAT
jgi:hypothetical protein